MDANTAPLEQLVAIRGIGPDLAARIVEHRKLRPFAGWADLVDRIDGIGDKNVEKLRAAGLALVAAAPEPIAPVPGPEPSVAGTPTHLGSLLVREFASAQAATGRAVHAKDLRDALRTFRGVFAEAGRRSAKDDRIVATSIVGAYAAARASTDLPTTVEWMADLLRGLLADLNQDGGIRA